MANIDNIISQLEVLSQYYLYTGNAMKSRAYKKAINSLRYAKSQKGLHTISSAQDVKDLFGIGPGITKMILEIVRDGRITSIKLEDYEEFIRTVALFCTV